MSIFFFLIEIELLKRAGHTRRGQNIYLFKWRDNVHRLTVKM